MSEYSRTFTRVPVHVRARYSVAGGQEGTGIVHDLSMNGLLLEAERGPEVGSRAEVDIMLESGADTVRIGTTAEVTRVTDDRIAFHFLSVNGEDYEHLEKLVLFNSDDAARTEQEMQVHADEQPRMVG